VCCQQSTVRLTGVKTDLWVKWDPPIIETEVKKDLF